MSTLRRIIQTPFPRASLSQYLMIALISGLIVSFILIVFQPYGTASFQHEYKSLLLFGYGVTVSFFIGGYYYLSLHSWGKDSSQSWTILGESVDLLLSVFLAVMGTYLYAIVIIGLPFTMAVFSGFMIVGWSVAIIPSLLCLAFLYVQYKDVIRLESLSTSSQDEHSIVLTGSNQNEKIEAKEGEVLYMKANDNYVMIVTLSGEEIQRYMLRNTLKSILAQLNPQVFSLCHRSYIVNEKHITEIVGNKSNAKLRLHHTDTLIPISRSAIERYRNLI